MPRSTQVHLDHKQNVRLALERNGFLTQGDLAAHLNIALSTVNNFFNCKRIYVSKFEEICDALGLDKQKITQPIQTVQQSERVADFPSPSPPNLSVYDPNTWVGRSDLIDRLLPQLYQRTRFVCLIGISGIGKTALAECLAVRFQNPGMSFHRVSFDIEGQSQDFTAGAAAILAELGETELDPQERNNPQRLSDRLLQKLQNKPYWIQLDALERLLPKESAEFVDSHWLSFFQRCLNCSDFPSRLVLTTQTSPAGFEEFVDRYPMLWHEETLQGLSALERLELFIRNGIDVDEANGVTIDRIGQIYEGHPLVLQVIAKEILAKPFNGNVAQYWERYGNEFEQVARELESHQRVNPALYSRELQKRVRQRVEKSLKRLPVDALDLLCRTSVYRRPVPETFWLALIDDRSPTQQQEAYRVLSDRALVEQEGIYQGQSLIRQHNLIRDVAYDLLYLNLTTWKTAERQAAHQWLEVYQPTPGVPNLEKVRGYLEAFHHFCKLLMNGEGYELVDWRRATDILAVRLSPTNYELPWQLGIWGYYQEQIKLYIKLKDVNKKLGCREGEGIAWEYLGIAYCELGDYFQAIECFQQHLDIAREIGNRRWEAHVLGHYLGLIHHSLGNYSQALECHYQHLNVAREAIDRSGEAGASGNIGIGYYALGNYPQAIEWHSHHLNIAREVNDSHGEVTALSNLGLAQLQSEQYDSALRNLQEALIIAQNKDDRPGKAAVFRNLAELHQKTGPIDLARRYCDQALALAIELGIPLAEECRSLKNKLESAG